MNFWAFDDIMGELSANKAVFFEFNLFIKYSFTYLIVFDEIFFIVFQNLNEVAFGELKGKCVISSFGEATIFVACDEVNPPNGIVLGIVAGDGFLRCCLLYTSPSPRDKRQSRMPSSA